MSTTRRLSWSMMLTVEPVLFFYAFGFFMNIYSFKRISRSSVLFRPQPTKVTKRTKFTFATKVCLYEPFRRSCTVTAGRRSGLNLGSSSGNSYCNSYIDCEESGNDKRREKISLFSHSLSETVLSRCFVHSRMSPDQENSP